MSTFNANRVNGLSNAMSNYMENKKAADDVFDSDEFVVNLVKSGYFENIFPMLVPMSLVKIIMAHANDTIPYFAYLPLLGNVAKDYDPNTGIWNEYDDLEHLFNHTMIVPMVVINQNFSAENLGTVSFIIMLGHYNIGISGTLSESNGVKKFEPNQSLFYVRKATGRMADIPISGMP